MCHKNTALLVIGITFIATIAIIVSKDFSVVNDIDTLGKTLGIVTIIPTLVVVLLSFLTRNVILSLLIGFLLGVIILTLSTHGDTNIIIALFTNLFDSVKTVITDIDNIEVLLLCLLIGGLIRVIKIAGGFEALADKLSNRINNRTRANLLGLLLGCLIFFDDYANALILGSIMTRFGKKLKIAKEKIGYIVNSTSAPVSGIMLFTSWIAVELSCIENGLGLTSFNKDSFSLLVSSVPYSFYCIFGLSFIAVNAITKRDYGPMYKAEMQAINKDTSHYKYADVKEGANKRILIGIGSIALLIIMSMALCCVVGRSNAIANGLLYIDSPLTFENLVVMISQANTVTIISASSIVCTIIAVILGKIFKFFSVKDACEAYIDGAKSILDTVCILIIVWSLSDVIGKIGTTNYVVELISMNISWQFVPILIFITCCVISLASGSYGCMFVIMPLAIRLAEETISKGIVINSDVYLSLIIGSVIAGSIFGDAGSPIADCTVLTSESVDIDSPTLIKTSVIYSLTNVLIAIIAISLIECNVNISLVFVCGIFLQILVHLIFGKKLIER